MNIQRTLKTVTTVAAVTLASMMALTACTTTPDVQAAEATPKIETTATAKPTPAPTVEATQEADAAADADAGQEDTDLTAGLEVGDTVPTERCEKINADNATFGHCYEMRDGNGHRFVRYGDPVPEEVRLDIQRYLQGLTSETYLFEGDEISKSLGNLEVGYVFCRDGLWRSNKPNGHYGSYDQMIADTQAWIDAGTSRTYVELNFC